MMISEVLPVGVKIAVPDFPIHPLLARRWSPYALSNRSVAASDLSSLFEAARWSASSYNEQPWVYIVASQDVPEEFQGLLSCLVPSNQVWAGTAPVLAIGIVKLTFSRTDKVNRAAIHDLGSASANLVMEATSRGLSVHQMIGIDPERIRDLYQIPDHFEPWTAMAIGYRATEGDTSTALLERDLTPRQRKPTGTFVFSGMWDRPSPFVRSSIEFVAE